MYYKISYQYMYPLLSFLCRCSWTIVLSHAVNIVGLQQGKYDICELKIRWLLMRPWQREGELSSIVRRTPWCRLIFWFSVCVACHSKLQLTLPLQHASLLVGCDSVASDFMDGVDDEWKRKRIMRTWFDCTQETMSMCWGISCWPDLGGAAGG